MLYWKISIHLTLNFTGSFTENLLLQQNSGRIQADPSGNLPGKILGTPGVYSSWPPPPLTAGSPERGTCYRASVLTPSPGSPGALAGGPA